MEDIASILNSVFDNCHSDGNGLVPCCVIIEELQKEYFGSDEDRVKFSRDIEAIMESRLEDKLSKIEFVRLMTNAVTGQDSLSGSMGRISSEDKQTENCLMNAIEENEKLRETIKMNEFRIAKLLQKNKDLENLLFEAENEEAVISSLKDKIVQKDVQFKCLNEEYAICKERLDDIIDTEKKIDQLEEQKKKLAQDLNDKQKELSLLSDEKAVQSQRCLDLENELDKLNDRLIGQNQWIDCLVEEKKQLREQLAIIISKSPNFVVNVGDNSFEESSPANVTCVIAGFKEKSIVEELMVGPFFPGNGRQMEDKGTLCTGDFNDKIDCSTQTSEVRICYTNFHRSMISPDNIISGIITPLHGNRRTMPESRNIGVQTEMFYVTLAVTRSSSSPGNGQSNPENQLMSQARTSFSWMLYLFALFFFCVAVCYQLEMEIQLSDWFVDLFRPKLSFKKGIPPF